MTSQFDFATIFTETEDLLKGQSSIPIADSLNGKDVVGLYFSAHWCPPCRGFTPKLADAYKEMIGLGKSFEIVFLSSDKSEDAFKEYYNEMPWLALPFTKRDLKSQLAEKYECQGIPYLVLLDGKTGETITKDGRSVVALGPSAFPFTEADIQKSKKELKFYLKVQTFVNWKLFESSIDVTQLSSKEAVAVFVGNGTGISGKNVFSALLEAFNALKDRLAVVYVPLNVTDQENEKNYVEKMPKEWFKLPENSQALADLKLCMNVFDPDENPLTIVLNGSGSEIYNEEASLIIYNDRQKGFPWSEEALAAEAKQKKEKVDKFKESLKEGGLKFLEGAKIFSKDQETSLYHLKKEEVLGLYFSAHWCGPCRAFTPQLADIYKQLKQGGKNFEVLFVSSDKDQSSFDEYFKEMPWLALDFSQRDFKAQLSNGFEVDGIPYLVLINSSSGQINKEGRQTIEDYGLEYYPWTEQLLQKAKDEKKTKDAAKKALEKQKILEIQQAWKDAKTVTILNHISQGGKVSQDYTVQFNNFNTFVADVKLTNGQFYYEVTIVELGSSPQIGWFTDSFMQATEDYTGSGIGDDAYSFGVDGDRVLSWYNGNQQFGSEWKDGDVIGFAFDTKAKIFTVSVNGNYQSPNGQVFKADEIKCQIPWISPGFTASRGEYVINFGDRPFKFAPPSDSYVSVHKANLENQELLE